MLCNPLAKLIMSLGLFIVLIVLLEDWITINIRSFINSKRNKNN